jgi:hypothetical protein
MINFAVFVAISLAILSAIIYHSERAEGKEFQSAGATSQRVDLNMTEAKFLSIQSAQSIVWIHISIQQHHPFA